MVDTVIQPDQRTDGLSLGGSPRARAWTLAVLDDVQADVLNADRACKTAGAPDDLIAERLALGIAGRARRLGL